MPRLSLLLLLLATAAPAAAQDEPGWGFTWERVGQRPVDAAAFVVDARGTLWAATPDSVVWLDLAAGAPGRWRGVTQFWPGRKPNAFLALGPDSLIGAGGRIKMTTDGGATWPERWGEGENTLYEVPRGHPAAGRIFVGTTEAGGLTGVGYSDDRGMIWASATVTIPTTTNRHRVYGFTAVPPGTVAGVPGRLVAAADWGVYLSDDGGLSWYASTLFGYLQYLGQDIAAFPRPGGGTRVVALLEVSRDPAVHPFYSDDGGETWAEGTSLLEPSGDGLGWPSANALVPLGGSSALALLGRGRIWRTEDGGATWTEGAQAPRISTLIHSNTAVLGSDGHLYVSMNMIGPERGWVYRTAEVLVPMTAPDPEPTDDLALHLGVVPNPATGAVTLTLSLPEAATVRLAVYDVLGREVAELLDGPLGAGTHAFTLDGAALPPGAYVARATAGATVTTLPFTRTP